MTTRQVTVQVSPTGLTDVANLRKVRIISTGSAILVPVQGGTVQSVVGGTGITVDSTDPAHPVISAPSVTQALADAAAAQATANNAASDATLALSRVLTGTGSPEGVVSAPVGTLYSDLAVTNGAALWRKATGSGNTGWKVVDGDTGWRKIASWTDGVQDATNQMFTIDTEAWTLNGTGYVMARRTAQRAYISWPTVLANAWTAIGGTITTRRYLATETSWVPTWLRVGPAPGIYGYASFLSPNTSSAQVVKFSFGSPTRPGWVGLNDGGSLYGPATDWPADAAWPTSLPPAV